MPSTKDTYYEDQLPRDQYEKYGHLIDRDKYKGYTRNITHYGNVQVRFKRDRILATFTFDDSLGRRYQPSLITDPHIESLDKMGYADNLVNNLDKNIPDLNVWQDIYSTCYVELQYHDHLDMNDVESLTFGSDPRKNSSVSADFIKKALSMEIELWYVSGTGVKQLTLDDLDEDKKDKKD